MSGLIGSEADLLVEAAAYFHSNSGLERLLAGFVQKYQSLGRWAGVVVLSDVSSSEQAVLESFFRKRLPRQNMKISATKFVAALAETRFGSLGPLEIMAAWYGGPIASHQEQKARLECQWCETLGKLMAEYPEPFCQVWLRAAMAKEAGTRRVQSSFRRGSNFAENMALVLTAMSNLPTDYQRLPVFAREICGNPHGLDIDTEAGKLLLEALRYIRSLEYGASTGELSVIEEISELLYHFRLLRDDLLNFASCIGLVAYDSQGEIGYWRQATAVGAPLNVPLREVVRAVRLGPVMGDASYEVLVVENSGVFSALLDEVGVENGWRGRPLVCLHGQLKLASWALLDRLVHSGARLSYAGDFDPEGLQIAQKILQRYGEQAGLWRMTVTDYQAAGPSITLDPSRLNKLRSITSPALLPLAEIIEQTGLAAYQEALIPQLVADVKQQGQVPPFH